MCAVSASSREPQIWTARPIFVASALLQSAVNLLAGVSGVLVSSAFCDGSGFCEVRGFRWGFWLVCCCALLAVGLVMVGLTISGSDPRSIRRIVARIEVFFALSAACAAALSFRVLDSSFLVLLVLAAFLGLVSVVGASHDRAPTKDANLRSLN